jgi:acyl-CoA reductase-like NAD-dependent aldehyde dehydrogenase
VKTRGFVGRTATVEYRDVMLPAVADFVGGPKRLLIDGDTVDPVRGGTFETIDPATGRPIVEVAEATAEDVDLAVASARAALSGSYGRLLAGEREAMLMRLADLVERHGRELAQLDSLDSGKPAHQILANDVALSVAILRYYAGWPTKLEGETLPVSQPSMHVYTRREPVGVVAAIVPWNFPLCQACFKLAPALAAGCTAVLKPAEQTPLSALRLGELALEAGFPPGALNVLTGFGETTGRALVDHPGVAKIAFTGSAAVGKEIAARAAATLKQVSLELGGKNPHVIFADADLEAAASAAAGAIFFYGGQVCAAGSRLMVERSVYDDAIAIVVEEAKKLRLGPGMRDDTTLGPLVSGEQLSRVQGFVDQSEREGARIVHGGGRPNGELAHGFYHEPTVLVDVADDLTVVREEVFGPVLVTQPFESVEELTRRANDTTLGLSAGVWTGDVRKAHRLAASLEAGTVWINTYGMWDPSAPWGGFKQSGYGRDCGRAGIEEYLQTKTVWTNYA